MIINNIRDDINSRCIRKKITQAELAKEKDFSVIPEPADEISGQDRESVLHACYGDLGL